MGVDWMATLARILRKPIPWPRRRRSHGIWDYYSLQARRAIYYAQEHGKTHPQGQVRAEHLLLAVLAEPGSLACWVVERLGSSSDVLVGEVSLGYRRERKDMELSPAAKAALDKAHRLFAERHDRMIDTDHILFGLASDEG